MGIKLEDKGAKGADTPGPGEYEVDSGKRFASNTHLIGTG